MGLNMLYNEQKAKNILIYVAHRIFNLENEIDYKNLPFNQIVQLYEMYYGKIPFIETYAFKMIIDGIKENKIK